MSLAVLRCDASPSAGIGQALRCLTLADALANQNWSSMIACSQETMETLPLLRGTRHRVVVVGGSPEDELATLAGTLNGRRADLMVIDHYGRDAAYEGRCRALASKVMVIDDLANRPHDCELILDQTFGRTSAHYAGLVSSECAMMLGADYAILRPRFAQMRTLTNRQRQVIRPVRRILVSIGTNNPGNTTEMVLDSLELSGVEAHVDLLLGERASQSPAIQRRLARMPQNVVLHTAQSDIPSLFANADIAVAAAGVSSWERCCLGLPTIALVTNDRLRLQAHALEERGAVIVVPNADWRPERLAMHIEKLSKDSRARAEMSTAAGSICDGFGLIRIVSALTPGENLDGQPVTLRPATLDDAEIAHGWLSDPRLRRLSRDGPAPSHEAFAAWFERRMISETSLLLMVMHGGEPGGIMRLERLSEADAAPVFEVSLLVKRYQVGLGRAALRMIRSFFADSDLRLRADIRHSDAHGLYRKAGFRLRGANYSSLPGQATGTLG